MKCSFSFNFSSQNFDINLRRAKAKAVKRSGSRVEFILRKKMARRIHYICCATQNVFLSRDFESILTRTFLVKHIAYFKRIWRALRFLPHFKNLPYLQKNIPFSKKLPTWKNILFSKKCHIFRKIILPFKFLVWTNTYYSKKIWEFNSPFFENISQ